MVTVCPKVGRHIRCFVHTPSAHAGLADRVPLQGWVGYYSAAYTMLQPPASTSPTRAAQLGELRAAWLHVWCSMWCVVSGYGGFVSTVAGACGSVLLDVRVSQPLHNRRSICSSSLLAPPSTKPKYYRKAPPVQCRHRCSLSYCELRCLVYIPMLCVAFLGAGGSVARCGEAFLRAASRHHRQSTTTAAAVRLAADVC